VVFVQCMLVTGVHATSTQVDGFSMDNGIYEVGEHDWQKFRKRFPVSLIYFYIPWCKFCKQLGPEYDRLGDRINRRLPTVGVAKVQTDKWSQLQKDEKVKDVPAVYLYIGTEHYVYAGERVESALYEWMVTTMRDKLGEKMPTPIEDDDDVSVYATGASVIIFLMLALLLIVRRRADTSSSDCADKLPPKAPKTNKSD